MSFVFEVFDRLPPLRSKKSPVVAFLLGFCCGGFGLGIYFQSMLDFFMPLIFITGMSFVLPGLGTLFALFIVSVYGLARAITSNARLEREG